MRVINQICVLLLWVHTLTFAQIPYCTLQQFLDGPKYDSNFDTSGLQSSYPPGKQIRVACNVGYSGFFKLTCVEGKWESKGTVCQPKSCGHPGNAQFADFNLEVGDDFVFGSKVVYTCHKGYQMVSRTNYRRCMSEGWDGVIPVCEVSFTFLESVGCGSPPPLTDGDIKYTIKSNYSHQERVEFMCQSYYTMEGGPHRTCINGEWTGQMRCLKPCIVNEDLYRQHNITITSSDSKFFTHDEIIEFRCARGVPVGAVAMRQRCNGGVILLPTCQ